MRPTEALENEIVFELLESETLPDFKSRLRELMDNWVKRIEPK